MARQLNSFRGEHHQRIDSKGRVSIPSLYRRVLESGDPDWQEGERPQFVIVYGHTKRRYLECYTIRAMEEVDARIEALELGSRDRIHMERTFHAQAHPTETDNDGRLVLPQKLRELIGLDGDVYFIAMGRSFQIWKPETYDREERESTEAWLDQFPDDVSPLSILERGAPSAGEA